ncbi:LANO_0G03026g1_1 [Lachancea nothofagi CBS 11611]|uniref:LANO_0G03026g1_1 n=1 Tax=Lachancea nothofagi CBS 11611 TaxID=1266666 RepID=A0A1G4KFH9_9SACH|nr:LANO_0G03026g1_1 [Lachancea nothofagi CBS 11611]
MSRFDLDVERAVRKACSYEETAPKRKHVRGCIVYTWDHKSSRAIFNAFKMQPLGQDEVSLFKALITIHKVIQEGHPSAIIEAIKNREWIESLGRIYQGSGDNGYGRVIEEYVFFLLQKLNFHRTHSGFNGTFEYEEYVSLVTTSNPDVGYETILDLMDLQDTSDRFSRILFASISSGRRNECKISALVPLVSESYGIYKFVMSMIRAMHKQTGEDGALEPLYSRFCEQHSRLFEFYADCSAIKYLTGLIRIPKLPTEPPSLSVENETPKISRPPTRNSNFASVHESRTGSESSKLEERSQNQNQNPSYTGLGLNAYQMTNGTGNGLGFYGVNHPFEESVNSQLLLERQKLEELRKQEQMIAQQQQVREQEAQQYAVEQERQRQMAFQQQQLEVERQNQLAVQQREQALFEQQQAQYDHLAQNNQFQNDLNVMREQHERDQLMVQQYDNRVAQLEKELENLNLNVNNQLKNREDQVKSLEQWSDKYDGLAKLYSQLRQEHLAVLKKLKKSQQVESSAKEAMAKLDEIEDRQSEKAVEVKRLMKEVDRLKAELVEERSKGTIYEEKSKMEVVRMLLGVNGDALLEKIPATECATNLANAFNDLVVDGLNGSIMPVAGSIAQFSVALAGRLEGQEFLYTLKEVSGSPEEITDKVIDLNIGLQTKLSPIQKLINLPQNDAVKAIINLIKASTACQAEIATTQHPDPYKKQNRWRRGLVSAAEEVAKATSSMVSATTYETFTVASNQVLASTAQLVAACRVKNPPSQPRLEQYSRIVSAAVKAMRQEPPEETIPTSELDLQAHIVHLENALEQSRKKLSTIRSSAYAYS